MSQRFHPGEDCVLGDNHPAEPEAWAAESEGLDVPRPEREMSEDPSLGDPMANA